MEELIEELEDDNIFGLKAPAEACHWSEAQIRTFFESDGEQFPAAPRAISSLHTESGMDIPGADAEHANDPKPPTLLLSDDPAPDQTAPDNESQGAVVRATSASQPGAIGSFGLEKVQWLTVCAQVLAPTWCATKKCQSLTRRCTWQQREELKLIF